ncbi:ubiquitin-like domain-containing protein [Brevibacterium litoralis]|uniref:ubiquitin-like domain-containing protein n=1 Tax=Brevibacterium litoralis TaxID=3138935 RepID=UPI0032EF418E
MILGKRAIQIVGQTLVIGGLVAGTSAFVALNKPVTMTVDGQAQQVRTFGNDVADVLAAQDYEVTHRDDVLPGRGTAVDRGMDIVVNTAKDIELTVDGTTTTETTTATTVGEALADLGVDTEGATVSTDLDSAGLDSTLASPALDVVAEGDGPTGVSAIEVVTHKTLTITADGESHRVEEPVATVEDALTALGLSLDADDIVSSPLTTPVVDGQNLTVSRVSVEEKTVEETIERPVKTEETDDLDIGESEVKVEGKDGKREVTYSITTVDGEEVEKEELDSTVLAEAEEQVVLEGTNDPMDMTTEEIKAMLGGPGSKWYQIAQCESTFNPRAVNQQNNAHFGLFQFKLATWRSVGGTGNPIDASPQEQFDRAKTLQARAGWSQWACA